MYWKMAEEWCKDNEVVKTPSMFEPMAQLNIGANFNFVPPPDGPAVGRLDARDPITRAKKWEGTFPEPPLASVLATGGHLGFGPDARGVGHAYNAATRQQLPPPHNRLPHHAGTISYPP